MLKFVGQLGVLFPGESKSAIKNWGSYLSFLCPPPPPRPRGAVGAEFGIIGFPPSCRATFVAHIFLSYV